MPEWLSIFLSPDLWESLTGPLWLTGNALFWSLALHALLSIPIEIGRASCREGG